MRLFLFRLAATLGWSVEQICTDMSSRELSEWLAVHRHFMPLPDPWHQTGVLAAASLAPYAPKGKPFKPIDFVPVQTAPQHGLQLQENLRQLERALKGE